MENINKIENVEKYFVNRELSWLMFNERVLEEAYDREHKILTRLQFLSITASNLDEFFMVRVAGLKQQVAAKYNKKDSAGLTAKEQLDKIYPKVANMINKQYSCLNKSIKPILKKNNISFLKYCDLEKNEKRNISDFFNEFCFPTITPLAVDAGRPFPLLLNKSLNIAVSLEDKGERYYAVIQVPSVLPRFVKVNKEVGEHRYITLEEIMINNLHKIFKGYKIKGSLVFRITKDADLEIDEDEANDLLIEIEETIKKRRWGDVVRLELGKYGDEELKKFLVKKLKVEKHEVYELNGPLDLTGFFEFVEMNRHSNLLDENPIPQEAIDFHEDKNIFELIKEKDRLIHLPYESFSKTVEFIREATEDPNVLAIKQTLYRVSKKSPIIDSLIRAAEEGKQVTAVVELKARFDEENNIVWARKLEKAGCHVVYGLPGLKIHSKAILIVRKEPEGIKRYVHLSTGNYNDNTAKLYTDIGLFTCDSSICKDISDMFNTITGYTYREDYRKIFVAPKTLRKGFEFYIDREIYNAKNNKKALIKAKFNSLVDKGIILKLYEASQAGVKIELNVRGICCLKPGIKNISENIKVKSIIGNFLEHSRIYYFYNNGDSKVFLSSADWMSRNLNRRIELLFPVEDIKLKERVEGILDLCLSDTLKARVQLKDGTYKSVDKRGKKKIDSQKIFHKRAVERVESIRKKESDF